MIAEIAKKKTGRNSESHGACREQGDLNSCLLTIGTRGCKVTRARLQELTHGARLSVVGGTPQNPWGKGRLRSRHRLFLTRPSQIRSKSTDAVVLGREFTPMCEKWETPFPGPSFLVLPSLWAKRLTLGLQRILAADGDQKEGALLLEEQQQRSRTQRSSLGRSRRMEEVTAPWSGRRACLQQSRDQSRASGLLQPFRSWAVSNSK